MKTPNPIDTCAADAYLAAVLEIDRVMRPHKERLFLAMREWVRTRSPNELVALIEANLAAPAQGAPQEGEALDLEGAARAVVQWDEAGRPYVFRDNHPMVKLAATLASLHSQGRPA